MADQSLLRTPRAEPAPGQSRQENQERRRNLRIAIRQLERAELYLVALYSLRLNDREAEKGADRLIRDLRSLRRYMLELKLAA